MCLGVYLCSEAALPLSALNQRSAALALAPEPAPWAALPESCVVVGRGGACGRSCGCLLDPRAAAEAGAGAAPKAALAEASRTALAAGDLRRLIDCAAKTGKAALLVYRIGDEDKTPEEVSVGCASYFGDDGAWLEGALERPKLFWIGAPAARPEARGRQAP